MTEQTCQHEGCNRQDTTRCHLHLYTGGTIIEYYCAEHCQQHGYCWLCGEFYGGIGSFEYSKSGLCPDCRDQLASESGDGERDEWLADWENYPGELLTGSLVEEDE